MDGRTSSQPSRTQRSAPAGALLDPENTTRRALSGKLALGLAVGAATAVGLGLVGTAAAVPPNGATDTLVTTDTGADASASSESVPDTDSTIITRTRSITDGVETITIRATASLPPAKSTTVRLGGRCTGDRVISPIPIEQRIDLVRGDGFGSLSFAPRRPSAWSSNAHLTALDERSTFRMVLQVECQPPDDEESSSRTDLTS